VAYGGRFLGMAGDRPDTCGLGVVDRMAAAESKAYCARKLKAAPGAAAYSILGPNRPYCEFSSAFELPGRDVVGRIAENRRLGNLVLFDL